MSGLSCTLGLSSPQSSWAYHWPTITLKVPEPLDYLKGCALLRDNVIHARMISPCHILGSTWRHIGIGLAFNTSIVRVLMQLSEDMSKRSLGRSAPAAWYDASTSCKSAQNAETTCSSTARTVVVEVWLAVSHHCSWSVADKHTQHAIVHVIEK